MLTKPDLHDATLVDCLRDAYGLNIREITFLPLGADINSAVYRAVSDDETRYFVKLRRGVFDNLTVAVPQLLSDQRIPQIIAPLMTRSGRLWTALEGFGMAVYPFIQGQDAYQVNLSDPQWIDFGCALRGIHTTTIPAELAKSIPREHYSGHWRDVVKTFQAQIETTSFDDPIAARLADFVKSHRQVVDRLVGQAERLGSLLRSHPASFVLCHSDIHAGNLLIGTDGAVYIVDWDNPIFAPPERDLMYVGGGLFGEGRSAEEEEALFYRGYGQIVVDPVALAYYRYERIVQDIAAYCQEILTTTENDQDRENGLHNLTTQFLPGQVVEIAYRSEERLPPELQFR